MPRVALADRGKLSMMAVRRGANRVAGWLSSFPSLLPSLPGRTDRLVIAPQDLRTADPTLASEIYSGRFAFGGKVVICEGRSPFEMLEPSEEWAETLFGFGWLRHLRAADSAITRANARALVEEWLSLRHSWNTPAWRPEVLSRRIMSWLSQATLILDDADLVFYRRFVRSLNGQLRYLRRIAGDARDGVPRLQTRIALVYGCLCVASQMRHLNRATRQLTAELERQILPDGGHAARNPGALIELLLDLLPLSQAYTARNIPPPQELVSAVDRMMPMLRFFRHGDGTFALFNGMGPTPPDSLATLIAYDDTQGTPVANAVHSGYQRLAAGETTLIMDTGRPPPFEMSVEAHAGCLSFEMSAKAQRIVVNCGLPAVGRENWRDIARSTAAHSTVTFNEASSCRFMAKSSLRHQFGIPIVGGPTRVAVSRDFEDEAEFLRASHDGYVSRFMVIHQRTVVLAPDGNTLDGEDLFSPAHGEIIPNRVRDQFAVRFHLHPTVQAEPARGGHGATLTLPNRDVWSFFAHEDEVSIEDDVFLGGQDGPRRTFQLVIHGNARQVPRVRWTFNHLPRGPRRAGGTDPQAL